MGVTQCKLALRQSGVDSERKGMTSKTVTRTSKGYSTGDTRRSTYSGGREVSRAYSTPDGKTREYAHKSGGGFQSTFKKK